MQTQIINGRKLRDEILDQVKGEIANLGFKPLFCDILVGDDVVSRQYVNMKKKTVKSVGMDFYDAGFESSITTDELILEIDKISKMPNMSGIIVQLPLPNHLDKEKIVNSIPINLDVDTLGEFARNNFYANSDSIGYPAAMACIYILDSLHLDLNDKNIVVIGQGELVGRPVSFILQNRGLNVSSLNSKTPDKDEIIKNADIIITATGKGKFLDSSMVKDGVVIIDAGTSESVGGVVGDVDDRSMMGVASYISCVPGGVGPVTIALLVKNILQVAKNKINE